MAQSKREKNKKARAQRAKKAAAKLEKAPAAVEVKLTRVPKRIRINFQGANRARSFAPGDILRVPEDIPEDSARSWLNSGAAVEDKSMPDPETKIAPEPEIKEEPPAEPETPKEEEESEEEEPEGTEEPPEEKEPEDPPEEEETKEIPVGDKE